MLREAKQQLTMLPYNVINVTNVTVQICIYLLHYYAKSKRIIIVHIKHTSHILT